MTANAGRRGPGRCRGLRGVRPRGVVRGLWPDRNILRRGSDRAEAVIMAVLLGAFLASAPVAASVTGVWAILVVPALAVVLAGAALAAHLAIQRRRLAAWEADWARTGPRWSRNR